MEMHAKIHFGFLPRIFRALSRFLSSGVLAALTVC